MAFKMKGSAFKLGNVATKSALKDIKWFDNPNDRPISQLGGEENEAKKAHNAKHTTGENSEHASMAKMKSPMKRAGIYKTLEDGTMVQISKSEADAYAADDYEGDVPGITRTADDAIKHRKENPIVNPETGEIRGITERTKGMTKELMSSYPTHTARQKKKLRQTGKSWKYNPEIAAYKLDNRIQAKINAGEPLTENEKLHQAEALRHLSMDEE